MKIFEKVNLLDLVKMLDRVNKEEYVKAIDWLKATVGLGVGVSMSLWNFSV